MSLSPNDLGGDETVLPSVENWPDLAVNGHLEVTGCSILTRYHFFQCLSPVHVAVFKPVVRLFSDFTAI